jgi:hypothetical protein
MGTFDPNLSSMPKKTPKSAKAKYREERRQLVELLIAQFPISPKRADAIAKRYGPSEERCRAAAETLLRIKSLGLGS